VAGLFVSQRDHPGYRTAEVGNPGRSYEVPCIFAMYDSRIHKHEDIIATMRGSGRYVRVVIAVFTTTEEVSDLLPDKTRA
jgi:hypothetical protein